MNVVRLLRCSGCEQLKPTTSFHRRSASPAGYRGKCKSCVANGVMSPQPGQRGEGLVYCRLCYDMPHRVRGNHCERCGIEYAPEPSIPIEWFADQRPG